MSSAGVVVAGGSLSVTTNITAVSGALTDVKHALTLPEGWTATPTTPGATTLADGATSTQVWKVSAPLEGKTSSITFTGTAKSGGNDVSVTRTASITVTQPLPEGEIYLSDMRDRVSGTPTNGWGPIEWDLSNGEQGEGDGSPIKIDGTTYPKGIGSHAPSSVSFDLESKCSSFKAIVGIDDHQTSRGTVKFIVKGDGKTLAEASNGKCTSLSKEVTDDDEDEAAWRERAAGSGDAGGGLPGVQSDGAEHAGRGHAADLSVSAAVEVSQGQGGCDRASAS